MSRVLNTEVISVGTELLLGHVTNTDARDVSERLAAIGVNVRYHTVVGDNPARLEKCIEIARQRADIILTTGGLGPTCDDLTKQTLAKAFGKKLVLDEDEFKNLYEYITARHKYTDNNTIQAMLPEGCTIFHNNCGTAPGCAFESEDGKIVIMLPGPPKECRAMLDESVVPYLRRLCDDVIVSHAVRIFGIGESGVDDMFAAEMNEMTNPTMAPYAKDADCLLQITAKADTEEKAEAMCAPVIAHVKERLGEYVYGIDVENLEEAALLCLKDNGCTVAFADALTGGEVARRLAVLSGSENVFTGAATAGSDAALSTLLGVDADIISAKGAVSAEVSAAMAENIRAMTGSSFGVGITGFDSAEKGENGHIFVALATADETYVKEAHLGTFRTPWFIRSMTSNTVYDMIRRFMTGLSVL